MAAKLTDEQKRWLVAFLVRGGVLGYFALCLILVGARALWWSGVDLQPRQPIAFPHAVHAGELAMACNFCHPTADTSPQSGVPPVETCMSCHRTIAIDRPEVQKLRGYAERREPIYWNRVHDLPDFIYFTHKRHLRAGIDCFACHGAVAKMMTARRVRPLQMGWCITCHRQFGGPTDCATCHH